MIISSPQKSVVFGQASWRIASDKVTAAITEQGGHLAPVKFRLGRRIVEPFSIAPWAEEKISAPMPALLRSLRGDFFCAQFGGIVLTSPEGIRIKTKVDTQFLQNL